MLGTVAAVYAGSGRVHEYQVPFTATGDYHIQGIARLPDVDIGTGENNQPIVSGRLVVTSNTPRGVDNNAGHVPGFWILEQFVNPHVPEAQAWRSGDLGWTVAAVDLHDTGLDHPGGIQSLGTMVVVAIEDSNNELPAEVRFYELGTGFVPSHVQTLRLDGRYGSPAPITRASAVAAVQLGTGHFLVYVAGGDHGRNGGAFFLSDTIDSVRPSTNWSYVSSWTPRCTDARDGCFGGAGNMTLVVGCDDPRGDNVWLVAGHGEHHAFGSSENFITVSKVTFSSDDGIGVDPIAVLQPETSSDGGPYDISYRWAGNFFITPQGRLMSDVSARNPTGLSGGGHQTKVQQFIPPGAFR